MTRRRLVLAGALLLAGCATPPRPFTEEFYAPLRVRSDAAASVPIAVYAFADERPGDDRRLVLQYESRHDRPAAGHATAPVTEGIARAFVRGLMARGFRVTDLSSRGYGPGEAASSRVVLTGRVMEFGVRIVRQSFIGGHQQRVGCRVALDVHDASGGRRWERHYARVVEGAMLPAEPLAILSRALADIVEQAVTDPELLRAASGDTRKAAWRIPGTDAVTKTRSLQMLR